ncbi:aldehyde dehydrogenase family protein, partial [Endobacter medicaginis]|nr:aldehyde dehydrogenase family protein [Endobacter medicaginis]
MLTDITRKETVSHWIDGAPATSRSPRRAPVFNPSTGAVAREVVLGDAADLDAAVAAARAAFPSWAATPP